MSDNAVDQWRDKQRLFLAVLTLVAIFFLIYADATGGINVGKFGYAGLGSWATMVLQFYFRKK